MYSRNQLLVIGLMPFLAGPVVGAETDPTFNKDVAPILFAHCSSCHRPNEVGPFNLLTYADAKKRGRQLAEITATRVMPPWKPVKGHGEFKYDRSLSDDQIAVFKNWHTAGMPEGDAKDLPAQPKFPEGWHLGTPDLIMKVEKPFLIPAEGDDLYVHFVLPTGLKADQPYKAVQILPSNRRVTHHAVNILDVANGKSSELTKKSGGPYVQFDPGFMPRGFLPGYAPGMMTREDQPGVLGKGLDVVLEIHYHPIGKVEFDQPQVGIYFTDKKPERNGSVVLMANNDINIPPGEKNYTRTDEFRLPVDYEFHSVYAHMHMIGKTFRVWAELPDKTTQKMFLIDDWDYRWQDTYYYKKPIVLPKGTVIKAEFVWDNSTDHPRNPFNPPKRIKNGPMSRDEMSGLILGGMPVNARDEGWHWLAVLGHYLEVERRDNEAKKKWQ